MSRRRAIVFVPESRLAWANEQAALLDTASGNGSQTFSEHVASTSDGEAEWYWADAWMSEATYATVASLVEANPECKLYDGQRVTPNRALAYRGMVRRDGGYD
jgi:hypothetical protein